MSPYLTAIIIFGALGLMLLWSVGWLAKRTVYKPIRPEEGGVRDEQAARDEIKNLRARQIYIFVGIYMLLCLITFAAIAVTPSVRKVSAALNPSATPTVTNTPKPTATRTASPTPRHTNTPRVTSTGNFLTSLAPGTPGTPHTTATLRQPSGGGSGTSGSNPPVYIYVTRVVNKISTVFVTSIVNVPIYQTVIVYQTVVVTPTYTPIFTPSETATATETPSPTATFTETPSPTPTETPTP
jgi:hypothetical protein